MWSTGGEDFFSTTDSTPSEREVEEEDEESEDSDKLKLTAKLIVINTNARSLCPKVNSPLDCFNETGVSIGIVSETWLRDGSGLQEDVEDFVNGTGYGLLNFCRPPGPRGVSHGGVSIAYRKTTCELKQIELSNPQEFEVVVAAGSLRGHSRK